MKPKWKVKEFQESWETDWELTYDGDRVAGFVSRQIAQSFADMLNAMRKLSVDVSKEVGEEP